MERLEENTTPAVTQMSVWAYTHLVLIELRYILKLTWTGFKITWSVKDFKHKFKIKREKSF